MSYALVRRTPHAGTLQTHGVRLSNPTSIPNKFGWKPNFSGTGVLSGIAIDTPNAPNPTPVEIRVLIRHENPDLDGLLIYKASTTVGAAFSFANVDPSLRYDIIGRMEGRRDQIVSNVKPFDEPRFSPMQIPVGIPIDEPLPIIGGTGSVSAAYVSGSFPSGVSLVGDRLQGTWPTGATGSYSVTFDLTDDEGTFTRVLNIELYLLPMKLVGSVPTLLVGGPISTVFTASGGEGPYTYSVSAGSLPTGLTLSSSTGELSGTPATSGAYSFGITATDVRNAPATKTFAGSVLAQPITARYWRVNITANNGHGVYLAVAEVELRATYGGADQTSPALAAAGAATASSMANSGNAPKYAFDDDAGTKWTAAGTTGWIQYDAGTPIDVRQVGIVGNYSAGDQSTFAPKDFKIQSSDDGATWTDRLTVTGETGWAGAELRLFNLV